VGSVKGTWKEKVLCKGGTSKKSLHDLSFRSIDMLAFSASKQIHFPFL